MVVLGRKKGKERKKKRGYFKSNVYLGLKVVNEVRVYYLLFERNG